MLDVRRITVATALVVAAAFPASAAAGWQDLRSPDAAELNEAAKQKRAEAPAGGAGKDGEIDLRSPDSQLGRPQDGPAAPQAIVVEAPAAEGFDWGDAGVGAAGGLAILTLASGMGMIAAQRRRRTRLSAITK
jgi:hypothetical protein